MKGKTITILTTDIFTPLLVVVILVSTPPQPRTPEFCLGTEIGVISIGFVSKAVAATLPAQALLRATSSAAKCVLKLTEARDNYLVPLHMPHHQGCTGIYLEEEDRKDSTFCRKLQSGTGKPSP